MLGEKKRKLFLYEEGGARPIDHELRKRAKRGPWTRPRTELAGEDLDVIADTFASFRNPDAQPGQDVHPE